MNVVGDVLRAKKKCVLNTGSHGRYEPQLIAGVSNYISPYIVVFYYNCSHPVSHAYCIDLKKNNSAAWVTALNKTPTLYI